MSYEWRMVIATIAWAAVTTWRVIETEPPSLLWFIGIIGSALLMATAGYNFCQARHDRNEVPHEDPHRRP